MSTIKFSDGTELPVFSAIAGSAYAQGANRATVQLQIKKDATTFSALDTLTADLTKTGKITLVDGDQQYVHDNYCIRAELAVKPVVTAAETGASPEQSEEMFCVTLAQLTYTELQLTTQQVKQTQTDAAIAELSVLTSGGNA